jgi:hypothetical protein
MDSLAEHDLAMGKRTPPSEKLAQALELMTAGIRIRRAVLRQASPESSDSEIAELLAAWLAADG